VTIQQHVSVKFLWAIGGMLGVAMVAGCAETGPEAVSWYYGPAIRYKGLGSSFAWSPHESEKRPFHHHGNPQLEQLVRSMIEKALEVKSFQPAAPQSANFWIDYRLGRREVEDSMVNPHGEVFEEGSLVLDVLDPKTGELIWRGVVQGRINDSDPPDVREKRLNLGIQRLMKDFPPK
jgi:hypothetical protein